MRPFEPKFLAPATPSSTTSRTDGYVVFDNPNGVSVTVTGNGVTSSELPFTTTDLINGGGSADLQILGISAASVTFSDLTIENGLSSNHPIENGNSSNCGGGIFNVGGTVTVNDSNIEDSVGESNGGGICNLNGTVNLNDSSVLSNATGESGNGGGIYNSGGVLQINGSLIIDNGAGIDGAGIYNAALGGTSAWLFSGTSVIDNLAGTDGGGIYNGNFLEVLPDSEVRATPPGLMEAGSTTCVTPSTPAGGWESLTTTRTTSTNSRVRAFQGFHRALSFQASHWVQAFHRESAQSTRCPNRPPPLAFREWITTPSPCSPNPADPRPSASVT